MGCFGCVCVEVMLFISISVSVLLCLTEVGITCSMHLIFLVLLIGGYSTLIFNYYYFQHLSVGVKLFGNIAWTSLHTCLLMVMSCESLPIVVIFWVFLS